MAKRRSDLEVVIGADIKELTKALKDATSAIQSSCGAWSGVFGKFGSVIKAAMSPAGAAVAVIGGLAAAMAHGVKDSTAFYGEVGKLATAMGLSTREAVVLKTACERVGITSEQLRAVVARMGQDLATGGKRFETLGISIRKPNGELKSTTELLVQTIEAINRLGPNAERTAAAAEFLGRGFAENINVLKLTPEVVAEATKEVEALNLADEQARQTVAEYAKATRELDASHHALSVTVGNAVMPSLAGISKSLAKLIGEDLPEIRTALDAVIGAFRFLGAVIQSVWEVLKLLGQMVWSVIYGFQVLAHVLSGDLEGANQIAIKSLRELDQQGVATAHNIAGAWRDYSDALFEAYQRRNPEPGIAPPPEPPKQKETGGVIPKSEYLKQRAELIAQWEQKAADEVERINLKLAEDLQKLRKNDLDARQRIEHAAAEQIIKIKEREAQKQADIDAENKRNFIKARDDMWQAQRLWTAEVLAKSQEWEEQQREYYAQAASGAVDAFGTAFESIITGSEGAGKAMLKAVVRAAASAIQAYAAQAAAANAASVAAIPGIGWALIPAAIAAAEGLVMALVERLPSAAGGFDIPGNLNPLVQTHAGEMVLPRYIADPLRASVKQGGLGRPVSITIQALDGASVQRVVESPDFRRALAEARRNGRL